MPSGKAKKRSNRIVINVGGIRHETFLSTLKTIPDTRLSYLGEHHTTVARSPEYDASKQEYFFDRHPGVFAQILNFYRTGRLHCPSDVCGPLFEEELGFWGIDEQQVETCCWENYKQHKEKQEKLKNFKLPGFEESPEDRFLSKDSGLFEDVDDVHSWWSRYQPKVWKSLEEPYTSFWAKLVGIVSFVVFTAYIIKFSLSTLDYFSDKTAPRYIALSVTHLICISWFTMDFALRLLFSPNKKAFVKSPYTWTDLIPLVLLYVFFFHPSLERIPFLEMLVMLKAARIFQLFKLSYVLQVLVNTLKASSSELCLLLVIMGFVMVVFASFVYFLERHEYDSDFKSVPESMWWAVITMTTVGYGEVYPRTWIGKTVGSACAICGVLVIALPVSVVASNFSLFYTYAKARLNLPPKKRRVAFSHALTSMHNQRTQGAPEDGAHANFTSLCSERQTERSFPSEISISCSVTPRGSLKKSSFWSLRSMSKLLRPKKRSVSRSKSLNSVLSDFRPQKETSTEGITLKFEPPSRAPSAIDISKDQREGSLTTGENALLNVPMGNKRKISAKESPTRTPLVNKSLYPLHLRRGAVSPASFSLKSASTASSLNALPRGYNELYNALSGKGPIILLSDQASMQSLCSLNSRMTCSCSSLRSAGSDGSQGSPPNAEGSGANRTRVGSDGSFVFSPTEKADGTLATLSVPVECHGKRRDSSESRNGVKETENNHGMSATKKKKCDSDPTDNNNETANQNGFEPVQFVSLPNERGPGNTSDADCVDYKDKNLVPTINDGNVGATSSNSTTGTLNVNQNNPYRLCWETMSDNAPDLNNSPCQFYQNRNNLPFEKDEIHAAEIKLPVKPVPVIGRAVSAYSIMEYNIGKNTLPRIDKSEPDSTQIENTSDNGPKRRHSAFTPCYENSSLIKRRKGRLSTGCMKEHVTECEPLINGSVVRAHSGEETDSEKEEEDVFSLQSDQSFQEGKRSRKSGINDCDSPTEFIPKRNLLWDDNVEIEDNTGDQNLTQDTSVQLRSSSTESLNNNSACGFLPIIKIQCETNSEPVRTSRV
ncbi:uncharacterized protein LOC144634382 [Oculina patagonica]